MPAVGGHHPETPLTASSCAVLLHQPLDTLLANWCAVSWDGYVQGKIYSQFKVSNQAV